MDSSSLIDSQPSEPRLDHRESKAIISRRLRALDHPFDYLDGPAIDLLIDHAAGSGRRLRAALASVLFLASTEDTPQIDAALVERALQANRRESGMASAAPRRGFALPTAFGVTVTALIVAIAVLATRSPRAPPTSVTTPSPVLTTELTPIPITPKIESLSPIPSLSQVSPPEEAPSPLPLPPPIAVRPLPVPPAVQAAPPEVASLPAGATPSVLLLFPAHSSHALTRLRSLALKLQLAGIKDIRARPISSEPSRRAISFFYSDDAALAQLIANTLADAHWPRLDGNSLQPSLVLLPQGLPAHSPGEIEVRLP